MAGSAIGLIVGGPAGVLVGGGAGPVISNSLLPLAYEIKHRVLGRREEARIGATLVYVIEKIKQNIEDGQQVRRDGFFETHPGERAAAKEVAEGVLLAAQREPQEKKIRLYGNLLANLAFHENVSREQANLLLRLGIDLSYQQLCALAVFAQKDDLQLRQHNYLGAGPGLDLLALLQEVHDLHGRGLLSAGGKTTMNMLSGAQGIRPDVVFLDSLGVLLHTMMDLDEIGPEDLRRVATLLS